MFHTHNTNSCTNKSKGFTFLFATLLLLKRGCVTIGEKTSWFHKTIDITDNISDPLLIDKKDLTTSIFNFTNLKSIYFLMFGHNLFETIFEK